jgi:hypothetical protein
MKSIIMMIAFVGILALVIGYVNQLKQCPPPKIEYRYIPRTFEEDQNDPAKTSQVFKTMFNDPNTWVSGFVTGQIRPNIFNLNKNNISQS